VGTPPKVQGGDCRSLSGARSFAPTAPIAMDRHVEDYDIRTARVALRETGTAYGPDERRQVTTPEDVCALLWEELFKDRPHEAFVACLLNTSNVVQTVVTVSEGTLSSSVVSPRDVYQAALLDNAAAVICAHNHPSGNPEPSRDDIQITRKLNEVGDVMEIPLHDHVIVVGKTEYTSLAERGVL